MVIIWSKVAKDQLRAAYDFIKEDSPQNATKVINDIVDMTISLTIKPEIYPLDKYKFNNDGSYRAFELHRYRVSYRILPDVIRIVRLRHTSRSPLSY